MIKLPAPLFTVAEILPNCTASYEDEAKVVRLNAIQGILTIKEAEYRQKGENQSLYTIPEEFSVSDVNKAELVDLYDSKLVAHKLARSYYDALRISPANGICPVCALGSVSTLDHYLPKSKYPAFSITPINLVPACFDCNHTKLTDAGSSLGTQTLHPYFDDLSGVKWLTAKVVEKDPPALIYSVVDMLPATCSVSIDRVKYHFDSFSLARLYASNAASALSSITGSLNTWAARGGSTKVREYLEIEAESALSNNPNDWRATMYDALAKSDWFCSAGYKLVRKVEHVAATVAKAVPVL